MVAKVFNKIIFLKFLLVFTWFLFLFHYVSALPITVQVKFFGNAVPVTGANGKRFFTDINTHRTETGDVFQRNNKRPVDSNKILSGQQFFNGTKASLLL
jgi:hypothetical protein